MWLQGVRCGEDDGSGKGKLFSFNNPSIIFFLFRTGTAAASLATIAVSILTQPLSMMDQTEKFTVRVAIVVNLE